jgi:hypothetical protein
MMKIIYLVEKKMNSLLRVNLYSLDIKYRPDEN